MPATQSDPFCYTTFVRHVYHSDKYLYI